MTPEEKGRFCSACSKTVIDFTKLSDSQSKKILVESTQSVCGRFSQSQLGRINRLEQIKPVALWKKTAAVAASFILFQQLPQAQEVQPPKQEQFSQQQHVLGRIAVKPIDSITIAGIVYDDIGEPLIGATVRIGDSDNVAITHLDGGFSLNVSRELIKTNHLIVSYVGYETQTKALSEITGLESIQMKIDEAIMGDIVVGYIAERPSIFKRTWRGIKSVFRKKG
ncbi:MAG: carboxypeptidase-like regulatory domain-containing protein [Saprospiraceae bacterium]|nr:carboxypeptidase-like regulatory domain-containing protein [Saprospiraceae bacterium]